MYKVTPAAGCSVSYYFSFDVTIVPLSIVFCCEYVKQQREIVYVKAILLYFLSLDVEK